MNRAVAASRIGIAPLMILTALALPAAEPPKVKVEPIVSGLDNPMGIAIRPGTNELFISESGAGRVVRILADKPAKTTTILTGVPVGAAPAPLRFRVGPLGLVFLDRVTFAVGTGGKGPGQDVVGIYTLAGDKTLKFDEAKRKLGPIRAGNDSQSGEGFFHGVAAIPIALFATSRGDSAAGWISRAFLLDGNANVADLKPLIKTKALAKVGGPTALAVSKRGELVVGESGTFDKPHDSSVSFYNPKDKGTLLLTIPTGLSDIVGLGYSPRSGNLYALDLSWSDPKAAGLYRIDAARQDGRMTAKGVKIASLDRPTAMAFASDGALYVTALGAAKEEANVKTGQVLKITGDL
jgi:DNA-binding beta-propeller fold protein YncE